MLNTVKIRLPVRGEVDRRALPLSSQSPGNDHIAKLVPHVAPAEKEMQQRAAAPHKTEDFLRQALPVGVVFTTMLGPVTQPLWSKTTLGLYCNRTKGISGRSSQSKQQPLENSVFALQQL